MATVTIADSGPGLDPVAAEKLFQPFVTTKSKGMEVGLSLSRTIVESHGGRITVEPNPGGGTSAAQSFTVYPPGPRITSVTNGASFVPGSVCPGEYVSIFGTGLGPDAIVTFQAPTGTNPIASTLAGVQVFFGATVTYAREDDSEVNVTIVGIDETDTGRISWISPVARALMGKPVGDTAKVPTPKGVEDIEIVAIAYPA